MPADAAPRVATAVAPPLEIVTAGVDRYPVPGELKIILLSHHVKLNVAPDPAPLEVEPIGFEGVDPDENWWPKLRTVKPVIAKLAPTDVTCIFVPLPPMVTISPILYRRPPADTAIAIGAKAALAAAVIPGDAVKLTTGTGTPPP